MILVGLGVVIATRPSSSSEQKNGSLASLSTTQAPWPAEETHLRDRLKAMNLPFLSMEGVALHIHQHIDIFVHGQPVTVPANAGIYGLFSPIHTHDTSGIIHVESTDPNATYTLKQFFNVWGVQFNDTQIGGYKNDATNKLTVYSNGQPVKDPVNLQLFKHEEIVVVYGTDQEKPATIPKEYSFPANL